MLGATRNLIWCGEVSSFRRVARRNYGEGQGTRECACIVSLNDTLVVCNGF